VYWFSRWMLFGCGFWGFGVFVSFLPFSMKKWASSWENMIDVGYQLIGIYFFILFVFGVFMLIIVIMLFLIWCLCTICR